MRLLPIRVALKTQSLEEWFWRLVFVGVVRLPLYGMVYCEIATRTPRLRVIKAGTEGGQGSEEVPITCHGHSGSYLPLSKESDR